MADTWRSASGVRRLVFDVGRVWVFGLLTLRRAFGVLCERSGLEARFSAEVTGERSWLEARLARKERASGGW